jgi:DNA-directed RNA polymerase subunit RPC12/RpoP
MRAFATIYKCSNCQSSIRGIDYWSGNTIGGISYSDTYNDGKMKMPEDYEYIGCSNCKKVFAKKDLEVIKQYKEEEDLKGYDSAPKPLPDFEVIKTLLEDPKFNDGKNEKAFTLWYLWYFNHNIKPDEKKSETDNGNYKKYTDRLITVLDSEIDNINSVVLKAEVLRERGEFDEATKILDSVDQSKFNSIKIQEVFDEMKKRIAKKDSAVFETTKKPDFIK